MIEKHVASEQMERLAGLDFYPRDGKAQIELIRAIESAENEFIAADVINEWLKYYTQAPKPAQLRLLIADENEKLRNQRRATQKRCSLCHGTGFVTVYRLVTYWPGGYRIKRVEELPDYSEEKAHAFREKLTPPSVTQLWTAGAEAQDILTGAAPCRCLPIEHQAHNG